MSTCVLIIISFSIIARKWLIGRSDAELQFLKIGTKNKYEKNFAEKSKSWQAQQT